MNSPPSFASSAAASASSQSGSIYGSNTTGDFIVGGGKNEIWIWLILAAAVVAFLIFKGKR